MGKAKRWLACGAPTVGRKYRLDEGVYDGWGQQRVGMHGWRLPRCFRWGSCSSSSVPWTVGPSCGLCGLVGLWPWVTGFPTSCFTVSFFHANTIQKHGSTYTFIDKFSSKNLKDVIIVQL